MSKFCCPNCGSENIQKMQIVYQSGTSSSLSTTTYRNNAGEKVNAETNENRSTGLASAVAPPTKKDSSWGAVIVCGIIAAYLGYDLLKSSFSFMQLIITIVFGLAAYASYDETEKNEAWNEKEYPRLYDEWCKSFICHKCGHRFIIK